MNHSRPDLLDLRLHELIDLGNCLVGRFLNPALRASTRDLDLLAGVLPDCPDGDLGVFAQLLDVPGDFSSLLRADREVRSRSRWSGSERRRSGGVGDARTTAGTFALSNGVTRMRSPCCLITPICRIGAELPWLSNRMVSMKRHADRAGSDTRKLLGEVTHRFLHPWFPVIHGGGDLSGVRAGERDPVF